MPPVGQPTRLNLPPRAIPRYPFRAVPKPIDESVEEQKREPQEKVEEVKKLILQAEPGKEGPPGPPGPKGETPVKGDDYFTDEEVAQMVQEIEAKVLEQIPVPENGTTPKLGEDYFTEEDKEMIVLEVLDQIPMPENGEDGQDAEVNEQKIIKEVLKKLPKPKVRPPKHQVDGNMIRFEQSDGSWGEWIQVAGKTDAMMGGGYGLGVLNARGIYLKEEPSGTINGSNTTFTLSQAPITDQPIDLVLNNGELHAGEDYTLSGSTITMLFAPPTGSRLYAKYYHN